jgi:hypothetical protein
MAKLPRLSALYRRQIRLLEIIALYNARRPGSAMHGDLTDAVVAVAGLAGGAVGDV